MDADDAHRVLFIPNSLTKKSPFVHKKLYHEISPKSIVIYRNTNSNKENNNRESNTIKKYLIDSLFNQKNEKNNIYEKKKINNNNKSSLLIKKINDIKMKLLKQANFNINKLKKYPITIPKISSFLNNKEGELNSFYLTSPNISNNIKVYLKVMAYQYIINPFIFKFNGKMKLLNHSISISKKKNILESKLNLSIRLIDILSYKTAKKYTICLSNIFSWLNNNNLIKNFYNFEYHQNKRRNNIFWIYKECTSFNYNVVNKPIIMPVPPFNQNDIIKISINLISYMGFINFESFKWNDLKIKLINDNFDMLNYNPIKKNKELNEFDLSKFCEAEILKNSWKNFHEEENLSENFVQNINNILVLFSPFLRPLEIKWDNIGYYLTRIKFKCVKIGEINNNNFRDFLNYIIRIVPREENIINEVRKNNLIYDNENNEYLYMKLDDILVFYFSLSDISENISDEFDID